MQEAIRLIKQLQAAKGAKEKAQILSENKDNETFKRILYYACHPRLTYKVSEDRLNEIYVGEDFHKFADVFEVCDTLARNKAVSNLLLAGVLSFLRQQPEEECEIYKQMLAKTLRLGVTHKSINKSIPDLLIDLSH